jgi:hypothetical protein
VRHFAAGDDAGARRPSGQVQQPGHRPRRRRRAVRRRRRRPGSTPSPGAGSGRRRVLSSFCVRPCCWVRGRVRGRGWPSANSAAAESPQLAQRLRAISTTTGTPPPTAAYSGALLPLP